MDTNIDRLAGPLISDEAFNLAKLYLGKLRKKQINFAEFLESTVYMAIQDKYGFNELKPHQLPTIPYQLTELENLPFEERQKVKNKIYETPRIQIYLKQKREIELKNSSNYHWLCGIRSVIKGKGDPIALNKVQQRIYEFEEKAFE